MEVRTFFARKIGRDADPVSFPVPQPEKPHEDSRPLNLKNLTLLNRCEPAFTGQTPNKGITMIESSVASIAYLATVFQANPEGAWKVLALGAIAIYAMYVIGREK